MANRGWLRPVIGVLLGIGAIFVCSSISPSFIANIWFLLVQSWALWTAIIVAVVSVGIFLGYLSNGYERKISEFLMSAGLFMVAIALILLQFKRSYETDRILLSTMTETQGTTFAGGFEVRPISFDDAQLSLQNELGSFFGAKLSNVTYVGDATGARWTGIADGSDFTRGLKGVISLKNDGSIERCFFELPAIQGFWGNALGNYVRSYKMFIRINPNDIYGDCINGVGTIYVPYTGVRGFWSVAFPQGIAVIDSDGAIRFYEDTVLPTIPGPAYPESLAKAQEDSLDSARGFWPWLFSNYGFEETKGEADPNSENAGQYNLRLFGGNGIHEYVTPLTAKGSSLSFVGMSIIEATALTPGQYNPGTFVKFAQPITGNRTRGDQIRNTFNQWDWINLTVREIVPSLNGDYVAYVGLPTTLAYIVTIKPDGSLEAVAVNTGEVINNNTSSTEVPGLSVNLSEMSDADFGKLFDAVYMEAQRRLDN